MDNTYEKQGKARSSRHTNSHLTDLPREHGMKTDVEHPPVRQTKQKNNLLTNLSLYASDPSDSAMDVDYEASNHSDSAMDVDYEASDHSDNVMDVDVDVINNFDLKDNCYYCTATALAGLKTVDEAINTTEIMQSKGGETLENITELFKNLGLKGNFLKLNNFDHLKEILNGKSCTGALGYKRNDGTAHMIAIQNQKMYDHQSNSQVELPELEKEGISELHFSPE
jgi:hypothetical protein